MKKNDWLLIAAATLFSTLFYQQAAGVNYFILTLLVTSLIAWFNPATLKNKRWWYYVVLTLGSGLSVFIINSDLAILATVLSLLVLAGKSYNIKNSVIVNLLFSVYSQLSALVFIIIKLAEVKEDRDAPGKKKDQRAVLGVIISLLIALVFFFLYKQANPLFAVFTDKLNVEWISIGWCLFTLVCFLSLYGIVYYRQVEDVSEMDIRANRSIQPNETGQAETVLSNETIIAISLFGLLNVMLLLINILDINNLYIEKKLPEGILLSDFVHNAVWSLVFSILFAVALILWFFKGDLNFNSYSKKLKALVYLWIGQSALMVVSAMVRNSWYIAEYQLTYLRIGVFVFLVLGLIGLCITFIKIYKIKTSWFLVRQNVEAWFLILALSTFVNWDKLICDYNMSHAKNYQDLDKTYLLELSDAGLADLSALMFRKETTPKDTNADFNRLSAKLYDFMKRRKETTWQSYNLRDVALSKKIQKQLDEQTITALSLTNVRYPELKLMSDFYYIKTLSLPSVTADMELIAMFKDLEELKVNHIPGYDIKKLVQNKKLKRLEFGSLNSDPGKMEDFKHLKQLEFLKIPFIDTAGLISLNGHPSLKVLEVEALYQDEVRFIKTHQLSFTVK